MQAVSSATLTSPLTTAGAIAATAPLADAATASSDASTAAPSPLFTNGVLNQATLLAPSTLSALFDLNTQGQITFDANGMSSVKGGRVTTQLEALAIGESRPATTATGAMNAWNSLTASDLSFIRQTTGANFVPFPDGGAGIANDDGGAATPQAAQEAMQLANLLGANRVGGVLTGDVSQAFWDKATSDLQSVALQTHDPSINIPDDVMAAADAWFTGTARSDTPTSPSIST